MKSIILIALVVVAVAVAAPADPPVEIIENNYNTQPDGSFTWSFKTSDGTSQQQTGELKQTVDEENKPVTVLIVRGTYSYKNDKGETESISFTADENGFEPTGDSIPKPVQARR